MKKVLYLLIPLAALAFLASPASAFTLPGNLSYPAGFQSNVTNASSLYDSSGVPRIPADEDPIDGFNPDPAPAVGDEDRAVFDVNNFIFEGGSQVNLIDGELSGLFYDLQIDSISPFTNALGNASLHIELKDNGRNPVVGDVDGDRPTGSGGVLEVWLDPTPEPTSNTELFDPNGSGTAPLDWVQGGHSSGRDGFPNVNLNLAGTADESDASLWVQGVFTPLKFLADGAPILMIQDVDLVTGSIEFFTSYINITGGTAQALFGRGVFDLGAFTGRDISLGIEAKGPPSNEYLGSFADQGGWQVLSSDPVRGEIIPEPASITLLGLGIAGLVTARRRRKRS